MNCPAPSKTGPSLQSNGARLPKDENQFLRLKADVVAASLNGQFRPTSGRGIALLRRDSRDLQVSLIQSQRCVVESQILRYRTRVFNHKPGHLLDHKVGRNEVVLERFMSVDVPTVCNPDVDQEITGFARLDQLDPNSAFGNMSD